MESVESRFIRYAKIDTQSCDSSNSSPSTLKQFDLLMLLELEAREMGLEDVELTDKGYLYATIGATTQKALPTVGFIAHVDTSPDMSGANVNPRIIDYTGGDIVLSSDKNIVTRLSEFPELLGYKGQRLIVTDGTTLLGADDKAGVAEIMCAAQYLMEHPEIEHGKIKIAFTPDEEIGCGADHFDVKRFGADWAYTMDGSALGEIEYENFNAASARITITGRNVHPGYAKDKMRNAFKIAMEYDALIPQHQRPEFTERYDGFYHLINISGSVDSATMDYIIRDHSRDEFASRKSKMELAASFINKKYGCDCINIAIKDQYRNMREVIENGHMNVVDNAVQAMRKIGIKPIIKPIRGGTDGSRLSFMGLPCPNIFAGGENFHGRHEFVSIDTMKKAVELIITIANGA